MADYEMLILFVVATIVVFVIIKLAPPAPNYYPKPPKPPKMPEFPAFPAFSEKHRLDMTIECMRKDLEDFKAGRPSMLSQHIPNEVRMDKDMMKDFIQGAGEFVENISINRGAEECIIPDNELNDYINDNYPDGGDNIVFDWDDDAKELYKKGK